MQGFMLDENGDVAIRNNRIQMVSDQELMRQTVESVLSTNKGEWFLNPDEGINFKNILGKHPKPKKQSEGIDQRYYEKEVEYIRQRDSEFTERLRKRLDGEL